MILYNLMCGRKWFFPTHLNIAQDEKQYYKKMKTMTKRNEELN